MPETGPSYLIPVTRIRQHNNAGRLLLIAATTSNAVIMLNAVTLIILSTELSLRLPGLRILCTVSLVFQIISAGLLFWISWRERRRRMGFAGVFSNTSGQRSRDVIGAATTIGLAQAMTLGSFIWCRMMLSDPAYDYSEGDILVSVSYVLIVSWALSMASEAVTFYLTFPKSSGKRIQGRPRMKINTQLGYNTQVHQPILTSPTQLDSPQYAYGNPFGSAQGSPAQSPKTNSPMSLPSFSVSKLPSRLSASLRRSLSNTSSRAPASPRPSGESAFDTWDTSGVPQNMRSAITMHPSRPLTGRAQAEPSLPPIPGSRPASPANALNGPFPDPHEPAGASAGRLRIEPPPPVIPADTADLPPSPTVRQTADPLMSANTGPAALPVGLSPLPLAGPPAASTASSSSSAPLSTLSNLSSPPLSSIASSAFSLQAPPPVMTATAGRAVRTRASSESLRSHQSRSKELPLKPQPSFARRPSLESRPSVESFHHLRQVPANVGEGEAQIHPLFRVGSPEPAPAMSPNTVLTGAPMVLSDIPVGIVRASVDRVRGVRSASGSIGTGAPSRPPSRPDSSRSVSRNGGVVGGSTSPAMPHMSPPPQRSPTTPTMSQPPSISPVAAHMFQPPSISPASSAMSQPPSMSPAALHTFQAPSTSPAAAQMFQPPQLINPAAASHLFPQPSMGSGLSHMFVASSSSPVLANMFPGPPMPPAMHNMFAVPLPSPLHQNTMAVPDSPPENASGRNSRVEELADLEEKVGVSEAETRSPTPPSTPEMIEIGSQ